MLIQELLSVLAKLRGNNDEKTEGSPVSSIATS